MNRLVINKRSSFIDGFWEGLSSPAVVFSTGKARRAHVFQFKTRRDPNSDVRNIRQDFLRALERYDEETAKASNSEKK